MTWTNKHDESYFCVEIHEVWTEVPALVQGFRGKVLDISASDLSEGVIGSLTGYIARDLRDQSLPGLGDSRFSDLRVAAAVAGKLDEDSSGKQSSTVVLVSHLVIAEAYRGHRLSLTILLKALDELEVDPAGALVLIRPEPLSADGSGGVPEGPARDRALMNLQGAFRDAGFEPWGDSTIWSLLIKADRT